MLRHYSRLESMIILNCTYCSNHIISFHFYQFTLNMQLLIFLRLKFSYSKIMLIILINLSQFFWIKLHRKTLIKYIQNASSSMTRVSFNYWKVKNQGFSRSNSIINQTQDSKMLLIIEECLNYQRRKHTFLTTHSRVSFF